MKRTPKRGNYAMIIGLMVPVVMAFGALGVDLTYYQLAELQTQYAADAAAHAAFIRYRSTGSVAEGRAAADYVLARDLVAGRPADVDSIQFGSWAGDTFVQSDTEVNAVHVDLSRRGVNGITTMFAGFLGYDHLDTAARATTAGANRQIMIAQDITGSFADDIANARAADLAFLDYMAARPYPQDMIGMTAFVGGVRATPWSPLQPIQDASAIRSHWQELDWCNCDPAALQAYYGNSWWYCASRTMCPIPTWQAYCNAYVGGSNTRAAMPDCWSVGTNTAPGPGIRQAADELLSQGTDRSFRGIILVSDGLPCCGSQTAPRQQAAIDAADYAWANGISVWTVGFNKGGGDFSFLASLVRGIGRSYETPDSTELQGILLDIASSIPVVTVQ